MVDPRPEADSLGLGVASDGAKIETVPGTGDIRSVPGSTPGLDCRYPGVVVSSVEVREWAVMLLLAQKSMYFFAISIERMGDPPWRLHRQGLDDFGAVRPRRELSNERVARNADRGTHECHPGIVSERGFGEGHARVVRPDQSQR